MEDIINSFEHEGSIDPDDSKFICGLSTILVATIQELKERISQIEFIFCNQLFPNIQSKSKIFHKKLIEVRKTAEEDWMKKEKSFLNKIEELRLENQQLKEQVNTLNSSLEQNKEKLVSAENIMHKNEYEKRELLVKIESLERKEEHTTELKALLHQKTCETAKEKDLQERLLQQIEIKDRQLLQEQGKRRRLLEESIARYKELKSQYNFLLRKTTSITKDTPTSDWMEEEKGLSKFSTKKKKFKDMEEKVPENSYPPPKLSLPKVDNGIEDKHEALEDIVMVKSCIDDSCCNLSSGSSPIAPKQIVSCSKSEPPTNKKRAVSTWRNTRTRQEPGGADPHDDFLDTPVEIARNLNKAHQAIPVPKDMDFDNSDDETQDISTETLIQQKQISNEQPANKGYKYVEPVRKRAQRESLKGVECKQCKRFYDAVLPDGDRGSNIRCEHHDGVSRHRYRDVPPMTPEGFWNIGFDSER